MDPQVKASVARIPLLSVKAGPKDGEAWQERLREEYTSLIACVEANKAAEAHWFTLESNADGTKWTGKCWHYHKQRKFEFNLEIDVSPAYPSAAPDIRLPELDGKTVKMYRGGSICMTTHFHPLWTRNVPRFGVAHALALGLGPWLSVEVPTMADAGLLDPPA
jgi:ufm1-conjugating enzyme 1